MIDPAGLVRMDLAFLRIIVEVLAGGLAV